MGYLDNVSGFETAEQRAARVARMSEEDAAARQRIHERKRAAEEAEEKRQEAAAAKRQAEREAERLQMAREQAAVDKERCRLEYLAAGGLPEGFPRFWEVRGPQLVEERMRARMNRVARPSDYARGPAGGTSSTWTERRA